MRILFVTTIDPDAESNGGTMYTKGLLRLIAQVPATEVVIVTCQQGAYSRKQKLQKLARLAVSGLFSAKPMKAFYFYNLNASDRLKTIACQHFDIVIYDKLETLWAAEFFSGVPSVLISQNLEYQLQRNRLDTERGPLLKLLLNADTEKLGRFEAEAFSKADGLIFISAADHRDASSNIGGHAVVIPPVFDLHLDTTRSHLESSSSLEELRPAFVGDLRWWPNRANLQWLIDQVLPLCAPVGIKLALDVYGKGSEAFQGDHVTGHGFVPDIQTAWARCDFLAAPTLVGGGLNVKIAEAVCNGVPVITTSKAAQAFESSVSRCFHIADTPQQWIEVFRKLSDAATLSDSRKLTASCANTFTEEFNTHKIGELLRRVCAARSQHSDQYRTS